MKRFMSLVLVAALTLVGAVRAAEDAIIRYAEDAAPAFVIFNNSVSNVVVTIQESGAGGTNSIAISDGTTLATTRIDGSGSIDTVGEFYTALTNATNASSIRVVKNCSLDADSTDGELLTGTYTATPGSSVVIPWDTSVCLFYTVYSGESAIQGDRFTVSRLAGSPGGTGNVTLTGYVNGTLVWGPKTIVSPVFVPTAVAATNLADDLVWIDEALDIPSGPRGTCWFRAARVTTATTGGLSMVLRRTR